MLPNSAANRLPGTENPPRIPLPGGSTDDIQDFDIAR
jgi:hypothetical protein